MLHAYHSSSQFQLAINFLNNGLISDVLLHIDSLHGNVNWIAVITGIWSVVQPSRAKTKTLCKLAKQ